MLVLSRKREQVVLIPQHGIKIVVLGIKGDAVKLGFEADSGVAIHREEVWADIVEKASKRK